MSYININNLIKGLFTARNVKKRQLFILNTKHDLKKKKATRRNEIRQAALLKS
jgi:hypothetical protein